MRHFLLTGLLWLFLVCTLTACETLQELGLGSDSAEDKDEYKGWDAKKFYDTAKEAMDDGNYKKAVQLYEQLESRFPFGEYASQAQLDVGYAYYKNGDAEAALAAADRFIKINPRDPHVDYAYYLKGLVNFSRGFGFVDRYLPTDSSQRDQNFAKEAYENFVELERRFPESRYAPDARQRLTALRNQLAKHEIHIARFYMKRKAYIAAIARANRVLEDYQRTPAVAEALQILRETYHILGMDDLARDTQRVYEYNFPKGPPPEEENKSNWAYQIWDFIGLDE